MTKINYQSDFKLVMPLPLEEKFIYHFTTDESVCYDATVENGRAIVQDENLIIVFEDHGLPEGQLKVKKEYFVSDEDFADGIADFITEEYTDIFLLEGASDTYKGTIIEETLTLYRGYSAYQIAVRNGFEGTEKEWLESLKGTITDEQLQQIIKTVEEEIKPDYYKEEDGKAVLSVDGSTLTIDGSGFKFEGETLTLNRKALATLKDVQNAVISKVVTYRSFNTGFVAYGWVRTTGESGPGTPTYNGVGLTLVGKETVNGSETTQHLIQYFIKDTDNTIYCRNATYTFDEGGSAIFMKDGDWKLVNTKYIAGSGITIDPLTNAISANIPTDYATQSDLEALSENFEGKLVAKQDILQSGVNIKTVNGESILGEGNLPLDTGKIDDVKVDGVSVVTDKVANIELSPINDKIDALEEKVDELQLYKFPNATIFGQPTINNGQVSNFTEQNYLQMPFIVDFANRPYSIDFNFTTPSGAGYIPQQNLIDSEFGLAVAVRDNRLVVAVSSNGTSWDGEYISDIVLGSEDTYNTSISGDGTNLTVTVNGESKVFSGVGYPYPKQIIIGKGVATGKAFGGSINLNYAKLTISDKVVWQGMDDVGIATRAAIDLSNIDAAGEAKIKEIAGDSGVTEERVQELINAAIGDMDAILDIMLGTSDIDGQLNRIIG